MVGFKSIALLLSLLIFAACVPQTKQTECGSNEAFNASLRTCVPVVNGPSSFINIDSYLPTTSLTKYKNDTTPITFSVVIDNPYAQTYTVEWERSYNGVPVGITPNTPVSYTFAPSLLSSEIGIHIISVRVKDATNAIVDTHNFQLVINDTPKPVIQSATVTPALYASSYTPLSADQNFEFTIYNNSAVTLGAGYRTDWKLYKSGVLIDSETDVFTSTSTTGYNYPNYLFEADTLGVGAYIVIARITNTAAEVVAEQQWSATVAHPALSKISLRDISSLAGGPAFSTSTIAYNNVAYTGSPTYNFIPSTISTPAALVDQADYCVTVVSGHGTYTTDALYVRVDFYLDGGTIVYSGLTGAADPTVCLNDVAGTMASVIFSNASATATQTHTIVARVVDEATGQEYTSSDMNGSLGTYPVTWDVTVKPQNEAPTVTFGATALPFACTTTAGATMSGCSVTSDTPFNVTITPTADDFYYPITGLNEANYDYSIRLYQDGVNIQTCTKTDADYLGLFDTNGADGYTCAFSVESYNGSGPIDLGAHTYQIQAEVIDAGSPIAGTPATSSTLTWNFAASGVTEYNTSPGPAVTLSVSGAVTEGSTIAFSAGISDPERDHLTYAIKYCTNIACTTSATLTSGSVTRTNNTALYTLAVNYTLPEDFLLGLTTLGCDATLRNATCAVSFFIEVTDVPDTATPEMVTTVASPDVSTITNFNPTPVLTMAFANPAPSTFTATTAFAFVGNPISFSTNPASILSDTSAVTSEKTYRYQWFIKNSTSVTTYTAIDGATGASLIWTPSHILETNLGTDNPLEIMLCVEDQPAAAVPTVNITDSICSDTGLYSTPWILTSKNNLATAQDLSTAPTSSELATTGTDLGTETAIWYDTPSTFNTVTSSAAYIAMIDNNKKINIKKVLVRDRGGIDTINATHIISFNPLPPSDVVDSVRDLSITGNGTDLYVAYLASRSGSPGSFYPQVRRIDISTGRLAPNNHAGKFGFDYDGLAFTNSCIPASPALDCPATAASGVSSLTFNPTGAITGSFILGTPNGNFTFTFGAAYDGVSVICSTCSGAVMASQVAAIINTSTNPLLMGYSAVAAGMVVTISGATDADHFDAYSDPNARIADRMGKIYISGASWFVPFINSSLGGAHNDKLSVYTSTVGVNMSTVAESILEPPATTGLGTMSAASKFDNWLEGSTLWIAMVTKSGSAGKLYKVDPATYALSDTDDLFSGTALIDIQLGASTTKVFVGATAATNELNLGIYDNNGTLLDEFEMDDTANHEPLTETDDIFSTTAIASYKIIPYGDEARIFAISQGTPATTYKLYAARLRLVTSTWTLSCGDCQTISESSLETDVSEFVTLGVAPFRDALNSSYRLSTDGSVNAQGTKDVAFVSYGRTDINVAGQCDPVIGVFNVEGEAIGSETIFSGTNPNEDAGLYRPPFFKN